MGNLNFNDEHTYKEKCTELMHSYLERLTEIKDLKEENDLLKYVIGLILGCRPCVIKQDRFADLYEKKIPELYFEENMSGDFILRIKR